MSVRLAPSTIISNVRISAACSESLRSRISALVRGLRLGSFTTRLLAAPPLDQSGRGGREPIELWQPMASTHSALSLVDRLYQTVWPKATKRLAAGSSFAVGRDLHGHHPKVRCSEHQA